MHVIPEIQAQHDELTAWRRHLHSYPELAYEEVETADFVAGKLESWGLRVHRGLARTGVVATLERGAGRRIALRADMDALPIREANTFEHRSRRDGKMHACGHDGHTVMLLGAARYLAEHGRFDGTIQFVFQPAEEGAGGAKVMIEEGLFERFPVDAIFGMHNWPGLDAGAFAMRPGPIMASMDTFDIRVRGRGSHGALPHQGIDPVTAAAHVVSALQTIVSRNADPLEAAVISVTKVHGGDAYNVIPDVVELGGTMRCFDPDLREQLRRRVVEVAQGVCSGLGAEAEVELAGGHPAVVNWPEQTDLAASVAAGIAGEERIDAASRPVMGSEDFAYMLERRPGCYVFIGNGSGEDACMIHSAGYDFNDTILPFGASYWARLAETFLSGART